MAGRSGTWFRNVGVAGIAVSVLMIWLMELLMHRHLPWWAHIPAVGIVLTLMAGGAAVAGVSYVEYQARTLQQKNG